MARETSTRDAKSDTSAGRRAGDGGARGKSDGGGRARGSDDRPKTRGRTGGTSSRARSDSERPPIRAKNLNAEDRKFLDRHGERLSKTTLRAKWVHGRDEHQDRPGQTLATRDPDVIRAWAEERRGEPATTGSRADGGRPRTLRFDFPGYGGRSLEHIDWDAWLRTFGERDLVFLYQEQLRDGRQSNFFRLDSPKREDG